MKKDFWELILNSVADGVFTVNDEWRITSWNHAAEGITGFSREEAIGKRCHDVFRANVCQEGCVLRRTLKTGENMVNLPINILTKDGLEKPISISTAVLRNKGNDVVGGVETFRDLSELENLRRRLRQEYSFQDIISKNHRIQEFFRILPDIAGSGSTVLIQGPSGSGKELLARAIHHLSGRKGKPFVAINCGALPDTLLESELFGYKAGAFTDAKRDKPGRFALAKGGSLFLDEIGDISAALQIKLLRVLQEKTFEPLGSGKSERADVRIIAATNRDLREEMARGRFREDLYYRLNVLRIDLPPLKDRKEDIPLLVDHFIARFNSEKGRDIVGMTQRALAALMAYDFPGNIRELGNAIERAFILSKKKLIDVDCLPPEITGGSVLSTDALQESNPLKVAEAEVIRQALHRFEGHRGKTAKALGMHKTTLFRKMKQLGIVYPNPVPPLQR
ncbi:MAG: sigma 54-interacting transcriptional regulator [Myxococcales bacterium]|nr:sigma 54-interacting transcriptional regulator [Myxococcales bacterium]